MSRKQIAALGLLFFCGVVAPVAAYAGGEDHIWMFREPLTKFATLRVGMTEVEITRVLGEPLPGVWKRLGYTVRCWMEGADPVTVWFSDDGRAVLGCVEFRGGACSFVSPRASFIEAVSPWLRPPAFDARPALPRSDVLGSTEP